MKRILLLLIGLIFSYWSFGVPIDSLRTESIEGKVFVIHKIDPKETLFGLSRRYKVDIEEIKKYNPGLSNGFHVGDIIRIPVAKKIAPANRIKHTVKAGETLFSISRSYNVPVDDIVSFNNLSSNSLSVGQELYLPDIRLAQHNNSLKVVNPGKYFWHVVDKGETLYGLSVVYASELEDIKRWNNIQDNSISIGDSLIVGIKENLDWAVKEDVQVKKEAEDESQIKVVYTKEEGISDEKEITEEKQDPVFASNTNDEVEVTKEIVKNDADFEEVVETGLAELIENSGNSKKYLALHRTAKVGTIIRVHNEMNGQEVFVRVIGKLPDMGINEKVLIKISQAAYDRLSAIDKKFRVRISYFPD